MSNLDFLEFQRLLLNKDIKHHADVLNIKSLASDVLCRVGTIRITFEPFSRTKHIIYFQHLNLASDQRAGFVEWPGTLPLSQFLQLLRHLTLNLPTIWAPVYTKCTNSFLPPSINIQRTQRASQEI
jgi:hypothetical protein